MTENAKPSEPIQPAALPKRRSAKYWDTIVLKALLIDGDYFRDKNWKDKPNYDQSTHPARDWDKDFANIQIALGIYPMSNYEGHEFHAAFLRLKKSAT